MQPTTIKSKDNGCGTAPGNLVYIFIHYFFLKIYLNFPVICNICCFLQKFKMFTFKNNLLFIMFHLFSSILTALWVLPKKQPENWIFLPQPCTWGEMTWMCRWDNRWRGQWKPVRQVLGSPPAFSSTLRPTFSMDCTMGMSADVRDRMSTIWA